MVTEYVYAVRLIIPGSEEEYTLCTCASIRAALAVVGSLLAAKDPKNARLIVDAVPTN